MFFGAILPERRQLPTGKVWQRSIRPNLAVRMRIARAHHLAAVLEDLHVINPWNFPKRAVLFDPAVHDGAQFRDAHSRNSEIMARRKTHHAADSLLHSPNKQAARIKLELPDVRQHRRVIVIKSVRFRITWRLRSARALITRAQIAVRIERDRRRSYELFHFPLPRPPHPMG